MTTPRRRPPTRVETARLVLRCWEPRDAGLLREAIEASDAHLRPWLPWMRNEPRPVAEVAETLRQFRSDFESRRDYVYAIFDPTEQRVLGGTGLHPRIGPGGLEIGYWIRADRLREGLATEAAAAMVRVGFEVLGVERLEIRCDEANRASAGVPRRLGFTRVDRLSRDASSGGQQTATTIVWSLSAAEHADCPACRLPVAF